MQGESQWLSGAAYFLAVVGVQAKFKNGTDHHRQSDALAERRGLEPGHRRFRQLNAQVDAIVKIFDWVHCLHHQLERRRLCGRWPLMFPSARYRRNT